MNTYATVNDIHTFHTKKRSKQKSKEIIEEVGNIIIPASDSLIYKSILAYDAVTRSEAKFQKDLAEAIKFGVEQFEVPKFDPSITQEKELQFIKGQKPAIGYSYRELRTIARENGYRIGRKSEYCLYSAYMINLMVEDEWRIEFAMNAWCNNSAGIAHYCDSLASKGELELTGSRGLCKKYDLGNVYKILSEDENTYWKAGGNYSAVGEKTPLTHFEMMKQSKDNGYIAQYDSVGWFISDSIQKGHS